MNLSARQRRRPGFTLTELIVVLVILVALSALVIPVITGVTDQANTASNASIISGVNDAEGVYEAQFAQIPSAWDGVLDDTGALYSKLNHNIASGNLDAHGTALVAQSLTAIQAQSLTQAGLTGLHFQDSAWTGLPSDSGRIYQPIASGLKCLFMQLSTTINASNFDTVGHNVLFSDRAFSIQPYTPMWNDNYLVVGFGNEASLKRNAVRDTPLFFSAQPSQYYARALCVFRIPGGGVTSTTDTAYFKAQYVGCFAPDGTCLMDNLGNYNKSQTPK